MKQKLLLPLLFTSVLGFAQTPVNWFYNVSPSIGSDGYSLVSASASLNENVSRANLTWDFSNILTDIGNSSAQAYAPTPNELVSYPGTDAVGHNYYNFVGAAEGINNRIFFSNDANSIELTGITLPNVSLTYTDRGVLGTFPLEYGYSNSDAISGTFTGYGSTGTFTGTVQTSVDAYGTFSQNVSSTSNAVPVTRLKIVQQVSLFVSGTPVGSATQTIYTYHDEHFNPPLFKSTVTHITAPFLNINETTSIYEVYGASLSTDKYALVNLKIAPNPVADVLQISGNAIVKGVTVTDISGREVVKAVNSNTISVGHLSTGVYNVAIETETGLQTKKIVKQ